MNTAVSLKAIVPSPLFDPETGRLLVRPGTLSSAYDFQLGQFASGEAIYTSFGRAGHTLIQGDARSGKTVTLWSALANAALMHDVQIAYISPDGTTPWNRVARWHSDAHQPSEAIEILEAISAEMAAFDTRQTSQELGETPLTLLAVEHVDAYAADPAFRRLLSAILRCGPARGVHVWMTANRLTSRALRELGIFDGPSTTIIHRLSNFSEFHRKASQLPPADLDLFTWQMPEGAAAIVQEGRRGLVEAAAMRSVNMTWANSWELTNQVVESRSS